MTGKEVTTLHGHVFAGLGSRCSRCGTNGALADDGKPCSGVMGDDEEAEEAREWVRRERMNERAAELWPKPKCCEAVQRYPLVHANTTRTTDQGGPPMIFWAWGIVNGGPWHAFGYDGNTYNMPSPTHCPFCRTKLPTFRRRDPLPEPLCFPGEDYCETCDERLMACSCLPHQCAYVVATSGRVGRGEPAPAREPDDA